MPAGAGHQRMDVLREFLNDLKRQGYVQGNFLGLLNVLIGRQIRSKILSTKPQVSYNSILLVLIFFQDETPLRELAQAELISITSSTEGRPALIKPGRPVFLAAFALLVGDKVFSAKMELGRFTFLSAYEKKNIEKAEEELTRFKELPAGQIKELEPRIRYLLKKIQTSQRNIEQFDYEMGVLKEILKKEV